MVERSNTPEPFDCKTPPNEINKTIPLFQTLEPFVYTLEPQNAEEALEDINNITLIQPSFGEKFAHDIIKPSSKYAQKSMKPKYLKSP